MTLSNPDTRRSASALRLSPATERTIRAALCLSGLVSLAAIAGILGFFLYFALPLFQNGVWPEMLGWTWRPFEGRFGIYPMVAGTLLLSLSAFITAYPLGIGICLYVNGLGNRRLARPLMGLVQFMTGIPTVVYGFVAVFLLTPILRAAFTNVSGPSWLAASLTLSLLILPTVILMIQSQFEAIEPQVRLTAASLGFSEAQKLLLLVLPQSSRGLAAAAVLGFGRAVSDTLIPLMLAGNAPQLPESIFASLRTLTAHIALVVATDSSSKAYLSLFASGLILFAVSLLANLALQRIRRSTPKEGITGSRILPTHLFSHPGVSVAAAFWAKLSAAILVAAVGGLMGFLLYRGLPTIGAELFFGDTPALKALTGALPVWDGIWPACAGTLCLVLLSGSMAIPLGIAGGIYISHYASPAMRRTLGFAANALAGVPSIVMGLFGFSLILFLRRTFLPDANTCLLLAAGCIALLILPYLINATSTAIDALPEHLRLLGASLGFSRWQSVQKILLPAAARGISGGIVLSLGRAAEDTAVILLTGVVANSGLPDGLLGKFEALPFQIYYLAAQYQSAEELNRGFGAALTLLFITTILFTGARALRFAMEKQWKREIG